MSHCDEKTCFSICKQQRRRSACAFAQSDQHLCYSLLTVQLKGILNFPHISVGNKTEWKDLKNLPLCDSTHFDGNTAMKIQVFFSGALSGIAEG